MNTKNLLPARRAFSLMELIVVISIIALIAVFTVPQAAQILKGSTLTQASTILTDQLRLARDVALVKNCKVEVRFYQYADPEAPGETVGTPSTGQFRAMQVFQVLSTSAGEALVPLDKLQTFPVSVVFNTTTDKASSSPFSSILDQTIHGAWQIPSSSASANHPYADPAIPRIATGNFKGFEYVYAAFRFLPDGSTDLATTGNVWYLTINNATDKGYLGGNVPYNYFCIQIDPVSGSTKSYRPVAG